MDMDGIKYIEQLNTDQHLWLINQSTYVVTSFSNYFGTSEILAFEADATGKVETYYEIAGQRYISNTMESHIHVIQMVPSRLAEKKQ
jgi:hypothetical protein